MSPVVVLLIVLVADGVAIALGILVFRRRLPAGGAFAEPQQAAAVFTMLGTTFAVLLAFTFLLAFQSYDSARKAAEQEAVAVTGLFTLSQRFDVADRDRLGDAIVCYARGVATDEWATMRHDESSPVVVARIQALNDAFAPVDTHTTEQEAAYTKWLDYEQARAEGRRGRLAEAAPFVPQPVWAVLVIAGAIVVLFTLFFADARDRRLVQVLMIGSVTTIVVASLLLVRILDNPYSEHAGSIQPTAMRTTLAQIDSELARDGIPPPTRCAAAPRPA